jgi:hypothetical protein
VVAGGGYVLFTRVNSIGNIAEFPARQGYAMIERKRSGVVPTRFAA